MFETGPWGQESHEMRRDYYRFAKIYIQGPDVGLAGVILQSVIAV